MGLNKGIARRDGDTTGRCYCRGGLQQMEFTPKAPLCRKPSESLATI